MYENVLISLSISSKQNESSWHKNFIVKKRINDVKEFGEWNESSCIRISLYENASHIARSSRRSSVSLDKISSVFISVKGVF